MDGNMDKDRPNYCRCFLREYPLSKITDGPVTRPPQPERTRAPEPTPRTPSPSPDPVPRSPSPDPVPKPDCDFKGVVITELASPENSFAKYIELYFHGEDCKNARITEDLKVISYGPGDCEPSSMSIDLMGRTINEMGFLTICNSLSAELSYGRGECSFAAGLTSPANLRGTETIAVVHRNEDDVIDIFGVPCTPAHENNRQYFVNGRAVRKIDVWDPKPQYDYLDWHVFPQCGQEVGPEGMDINEWKDVQGPICAPETTIIITEIVDLDVDREINVPRFVELYAPRRRHRGMGFNHNLKLVIFHSDSLEPHWPSSVPIDYMPENGFMVVCNSAAYRSYGVECAVESSDIAGPANSNGNDQIALISGDEDGWFVVDIYGVIGEDGYDTDHDFYNSRVIRKLDVTEAQATWSKHDWQLCPSDIPDPNHWNSDECGSAEDAPSLMPTNFPTPESQKDCQFFFTELSDVDSSFIEIKSTCPGITINRDLVVVSWKEHGLSCELPLKGVVVPDDGFIIICANKFQHLAEYGSKADYFTGQCRRCDLDDYMLFAGFGFNSYAIEDKGACDGGHDDDCMGSNCFSGCNDKYLDIYGYPGATVDYTDHVYEDCRAVRKMKYPYGISPFNPQVWEIICINFSLPTEPGEDPDPCVWKEVPLLLFFSEFCDPEDDKNGRMIELYSPNKRDYKIEEDLIVMKYEGTSPYPSTVFQSLKGHVVNSNGFVVMCMNWYTYGRDTCTLVSGWGGITAFDGTEHFSLAGCEYPSNDCHCIDIYGSPGMDGRRTGQQFTDGKVFRMRTVPAPKKVFDINHWVHVDDISVHECGAGKTPPPVTYPTPSGGKGKGKGKGKYWRK